MNAITSISPTHVNKGIQAKAIQSWLKLGFKVYSVNHESELKILKPLGEYKGVTFLSTYKTMFNLYGKHYVAINELLDVGINMKDNFVIINSDIELYDENEMLPQINNCINDNKFVFVPRHDYDENIESNTSPLEWGIDVFFFSPTIAKLMPFNSFCMGQCWWDFWIPFNMLKNNIEVLEVKKRLAFHQKHEQQWSLNQWTQAKDFFLIENYDLVKHMPNIGMDVRVHIRNNSKELI